ncbi:MAG: 16S rRNA (uracil(1498)-N(3))-methyltransferase [Xanthomonadales bacterium]|nr:16S rRNA (uracil(1498)-N(3))-methyltransferase [Xanthomonadales bacterium]
MRVSRLYTAEDLAPDQDVTLEERTGHYLHRVLRLRPGDGLVLFNGDGFDYAAELLAGPRDPTRVRVNTRLPAVAEPELEVVLVQAVGKGDRMDTALQKSTELGVSAVQPVFTERTEVRLSGERLEKRQAHWRGVLIAACEQSGRARLPELRTALSLDDWLASPPASHRLVLAPGAERALASVQPRGGVEIVIGPEGGFSESELRRLALGGCLPVALGPRILRTETAGPAALAVLQAIAGDFAAD